jgi:hypothetical protein
MPRKLGIQCPGVMNPVMNRGDQCWGNIFRDDADREHFLATLGGNFRQHGITGEMFAPEKPRH